MHQNFLHVLLLLNDNKPYSTTGLCGSSGGWSRCHHFGWRGHLHCWIEQLRPASHYCWGLRLWYVSQSAVFIGEVSTRKMMSSIFAWTAGVNVLLTTVPHTSSFRNLLLRCSRGEEGLWFWHQGPPGEEILPHWTGEICRLEHSHRNSAVHEIDWVVRHWGQPCGRGWVTHTKKLCQLWSKCKMFALLISQVGQSNIIFDYLSNLELQLPLRSNLEYW